MLLVHGAVVLCDRIRSIDSIIWSCSLACCGRLLALCLEAKIVCYVILQLSDKERNGYFCGYHVDGRSSDGRLG